MKIIGKDRGLLCLLGYTMVFFTLQGNEVLSCKNRKTKNEIQNENIENKNIKNKKNKRR